MILKEKKRLHGVIYREVIYCSWLFIHSKQCLPLKSKIIKAALSLFCELGISSTRLWPLLTVFARSDKKNFRIHGELKEANKALRFFSEGIVV